MCASLAKGESVIHNASDSDDTALMVNGLNQLGVLVRNSEAGLVVDGNGGKLYAPKFPIPVGNAGTTLRFLMALGSIAQGKVVFVGDRRMAERPIEDLLDALHMFGVEATADGRISRFTVDGGSLRGGVAKVQGDKSSQFLSSLVMVSPYANQNVTIEIEEALTSQPYVDMTVEVMKQFGISITRSDDKRYEITAGERYKPIEFNVEHDTSSACYFLAACAIAGGEVVTEGVRLTSMQGDIGFVNVLRKMGCYVVERSGGVAIDSDQKLRGVDVNMNSMPDLVPTLAVTALFAKDKTHIRNIAHLRYKESDRLEALVTELKKLGADITLTEDGLSITPVEMHGAQLDTYDDHRLAMSFALIGLRVPGVKIENPNCVGKSFPEFWKEFEKLYVK
jgi:3-phosphoshikimate 1-carboxyvinyltransferase